MKPAAAHTAAIGEHILISDVDTTNVREFHISLVKFSKSAQELVSFIKQDELSAIKNVVKAVSPHVKSLEVHKIVSRNANGGYQYQTLGVEAYPEDCLDKLFSLS